MDMDGDDDHSNSQTPSHSSHSPSPDSPTNSDDLSFLNRVLTDFFANQFLRPTSDSSPQPETKTSPAAPTAAAPATATTAAPVQPIPFFSADDLFSTPAPRPSQLSASHSALAPASSRSRSRSHDSNKKSDAPPPMGTPQANVVFCTEDTVGLKDDKFSVGVIDRSFGDVDTHSPRPQRDYGEDIERHPDISQDDFDRFMRQGIPPRGTALVSWQSQLKTELIPEARLELLDRALYVGDVVKRNSTDPMSGTVIATKALCSIFPSVQFHSGNITQAMTEDLSIRKVPAEELINVAEYNEGGIVVFNHWVGRIEQVYDEIAVRLSNNSVVVVEDPDDLETEDVMLERLSVGDRVKTKKGNLRRGLWRYGAFDPNVRPEGTIVETRTVWIDVHWLTRNIGAPVGEPYEEPSHRIYHDDLSSPDFYVYDASASAAIALPLSADGETLSYHVAEVAVGDRVRFKDLAGAAVKYDGSKTLPNGYPQGKLTRIPRTETLGYDMNVFIIMQTHTQVTVQWQDLSISEDPSPSLLPDATVEDEDEVWPGEIVYTKQRHDGAYETALDWTFKPAKVGIVQSVKSRDRLATIRWFEEPNIQFLGEDLIPPSKTGKLREDTEDVSLYDVSSKPSLTRRRGDFVLVHPGAISPQAIPTNLSGPKWFGEVIDLGLDGNIAVRLGAAKPVVDVRIPIETVTLAYSSGMNDQFLNMDGMEGESDDYDDDYENESEVSDFDTASFNEMWIEYEGMDGASMDDGNEDDWSTEDDGEMSDEDEDTSMPDLEPVDGARTTNTTPEAHSELEKKPREPQHTTPNPQTSSTVSPPGQENPLNLSSQANENAPAPFLVLDDPPPPTHHYIDQTARPSPTFTRRIAKEHKILRTSLPPGIFVRTWESRLDLLRVLMIGPSDTPYEFAPFVIDFHLPSTYPSEPPLAFFHSWTQGNGPVNPNLYQDGKICLSLLGTWHADERGESWSAGKSTLLQVLVSLMGLVLVKEPYYNEAGYDIHRTAPETKLSSSLYTERAYFRARGFIAHALSNDVAPFQQELDWLYRSREDGAPRLLERAIRVADEVLDNSREADEEDEKDGLRKISLGATVMLRRQVERLKEILSEQENRAVSSS
ncbi:hypothetical protein DM02DRAFT_612991 [Periconia macrospinosa]|uniref:UBC core domain-containing protein n=1 Tax=Periconia macrospinosa TaxID=97972 RepID=A0A2V1DW93_9PLEO|nr:hypothetical protein DM02DRAFT_612991 [Periconia macrospinosa]